jgi:TP901 family phage tail tape measure protein
VALNNLGLGLVITARDLSKSAFESAQASLGLTGVAVEELDKKTRKSADTFNQAALIMSGAGAAILGGLAFATAKAEELEQAFRLVSTRADETILPMSKVRDLALEQSNAFGISQTAEAKALYDAIGKGATDAASAQAVLVASNQLAVGTQNDLQVALDANTQVIRAFHLAMSDAGKVSDQLFNASSRGAGTIEELAQSLEHLAPGAARAGLSSGDLLGAITAMSNAGLKGRPAIGGLKAVIDSLIQPTADAKAQAAALGITLDTAKIAAQGFGPWMASLAGRTDLTSERMAKLFGSTEATTAVMALMKNKGADLNETLATMSGKTGEVGAAAETMTSQWTRAKTLMENALTKLGQAFLPITEPILRLFNGMVEGFTHLSPATQKAIAFGLAFVGVALLIAGSIAAGTAAVATFGATMAPVIATALAVLWPVVAAMAAIAAVAFVVKLAWDHNFGGIRDTVTAFWDKIRLVWDGISQLFSQGGFSGAVLGELNKAGNGGIKNFVVSLFLWGNRIKAFWDGLTSGVEIAFQALAPISATLGEIFSELGTILGQIFGSLFGGPNNPDRAAAMFRAMAQAGALVGDVLGLVLRSALVLLQIALTPLRLVMAGLTGGWAGFRHAALEAFADVVKGMLQMVATAAGIADHLAGIFGKNLGAQKAITDFAKTVDSELRPSVAPFAEKPAGPGANAVPSTRVGSDSAVVVEAHAAADRIRHGETGAAAESDRHFVQQLLPVLEAIRKNGNQPVVIHVDSEQLATITRKNAEAHAARGFAPTPAPG